MELSDWEHKVTMINILWVLMEKVDMKENLDNASREMETIRIISKVNSIKAKQLYNNMKSSFHWFISKLDWTEESINDFEDTSVETFQTEKQREKRMKKPETEYPRTMKQLQRSNTNIMEMPEREEGDKRTEEIGEVIMAENFP